MVLESQKYYWWTLIDQIGRELRDEYVHRGGAMAIDEIDSYLRDLVRDRAGEVSPERAQQYMVAFDCYYSYSEPEMVRRVEDMLVSHAMRSFRGFLMHSVV